MGRLFDIFVKSYALSPEQDKEFFSYIGDLYATEEVQCMRKYPQHSSANRLDHIKSVTYMTYVLSKKLSLDAKLASRAALLHDLVYYDWHDADISHRPHGFRHPGFAVLNARLLNPDITKKEEKIISRHMWPLTPLPPSSLEGMVVTFADKYCASREMQVTKKSKLKEEFESKLHALGTQLNRAGI